MFVGPAVKNRLFMSKASSVSESGEGDLKLVDVLARPFGEPPSPLGVAAFTGGLTSGSMDPGAAPAPRAGSPFPAPASELGPSVPCVVGLVSDDEQPTATMRASAKPHGTNLDAEVLMGSTTDARGPAFRLSEVHLRRRLD